MQPGPLAVGSCTIRTGGAKAGATLARVSTPLGRVLVTGANGHLGRHLLQQLSTRAELRAAVRSERARAQLDSLPPGTQPPVQLVDYSDTEALSQAAAGCRAVVHLVGILKEGSTSKYVDAHEASCTALARAAEAAGVERIVYLSILGASESSANACLNSKARAESVLLKSKASAVVLRAPMVLGREDAASRSLRGQARARLLPLIAGGRSMQQPIDARDVIAAVEAAISLPELADRVFDLGGPECLSHRDLVLRAAALYGKLPHVIPVPLALVRSFAALGERLSKDPPLTRAMLEVLQHDDRVDALAASTPLGIELTPLDETLRRYVGPDAGSQTGS